MICINLWKQRPISIYLFKQNAQPSVFIDFTILHLGLCYTIKKIYKSIKSFL